MQSTTEALTEKLDAAAARVAAHPLTGPVLWRVERTDSDWSWSFGEQEQPIFIASITKLYTTALLLRLVDAGLVTLDAPAADYLPAGTMVGLNTHGGVDHGAAISVRQLLSQTSGIADYFEGPGGFLAEALAGDVAWTPEEAIERTRRMPARFAPGTNRAHYSDTNFTLLGLVIEQAGGQSYRDALGEHIFGPLGLGNTYLFDPDTIERYDEVAPFFSKGQPLRLPKTLASCGSQGAIVSTLPECTLFLRAFFGTDGSSTALFGPQWLPQLTAHTNAVFGPLRYGLGVMRYTLPRVFTLFEQMPELIGHSGSIGSVLYYAPEKNLVIAGTVNQMDKRQFSHQALARIALLAGRD